MDGKTAQEVKEALLARWKRIARKFPDRLQESASEDYSGSQAAEIIDMAQALEQIGRDASLQEAERRELLAIERALAKMATGSYGVCEDCLDEIPLKRLLALPEARLCAQCQAFEEKQNTRSRWSGNWIRGSA
ncbi:MAG: TraR/DksA family transcriptional regulator [Bdellovibrionia bacterium]